MNPGDVVQVRSGGPKMTVVSHKVSSDNLEYVRCVYFAKDGTAPTFAELPKLTLRVIRQENDRRR